MLGVVGTGDSTTIIHCVAFFDQNFVPNVPSSSIHNTLIMGTLKDRSYHDDLLAAFISTWCIFFSLDNTVRVGSI